MQRDSDIMGVHTDTGSRSHIRFRLADNGFRTRELLPVNRPEQDTPGTPGKRVFTVDPRFRIKAKKGDFLGFHYGLKSDKGALASWSKDDTNVTVDDVTMHQTITAGLYDENFLLNVPINFNTNDRKVRMVYSALSAIIQPDSTASQPTSVPGKCFVKKVIS